MLEEEPAPPRPIDRFARTSAGLVLRASLLGLRDVFEGPRDDEPAIVQEQAGEPPEPGAVSMRLDPDHAQDSIILVRPWLLPGRDTSRGQTPPEP
jgi:hypothetical protein